MKAKFEIIFLMELKVEILGEMIKSVRKEKHLTQEQLGKLVGVNKHKILS